VPALIAGLEEIKDAAADDELTALESRRWYATLARRLKELGIDPRDPKSFTVSTPAVSHMVIGEPLTEGLKNLRSYEEEEGEAV